jgi:hypothetical protein
MGKDISKKLTGAALVGAAAVSSLAMADEAYARETSGSEVLTPENGYGYYDENGKWVANRFRIRFRGIGYTTMKIYKVEEGVDYSTYKSYVLDENTVKSQCFPLKQVRWTTVQIPR